MPDDRRSPVVRRPYTRREYAVALTLNAVGSTFNVVILLVVAIVATILAGPVVGIPAGVALYAGACARTFFDHDAADAVIARVRQERRATIEASRERLDLDQLAPHIAAPLHDAREREQRIRQAIARAEMPFDEVSDEVDKFLDAFDVSARRAQMLSEVLGDNPTAATRRRLQQVEQNPDKAELAEALRQQLAVSERCQRQLQRYFDETERLLVELDTIRAALVSASASTNADDQRRISREVHGLRTEVAALADGMQAAFEDERPAAT